MSKKDLLKGLIALQAISMIILTVIVVLYRLPSISHPGPSSETNENIDTLGSEVVAMVGSEQITMRELQEQLEMQYGEQMLHTLMLHRAIRMEAETYGFSVSPQELEDELARMMEGYVDEAEFYRTMEEQLGLTKEDVGRDAEYRLLLEKIAITPIVLTDEEVRAYIDDHPDLFGPRTQIRLAWIVTETRRLAEQAVQELSEGENFAALARRYSIDEFTAGTGGDLGRIEADDPFIDENVLEAAAELEVGDIAGPVPIDSGYAVIKLNEREVIMQYDEQRKQEMARKQLALSKAKPLHEVEQDLLRKYDANVVRQP
ncbi:peptidylprolyl isomerase [Paenibacillus abyssi]|uniref:Foldase protein PrsA n=1 Tax=Paenibacillus abyssi TaxID=1340531 RepID=A0A917LHS1_9BACL|nr:peptidyl-prolyl cis-trans isomerase [Paenibacillus abyssi]GGG24864.1 foldase protein PrsA [Paenibacillus abyssi]